MADTYSIKFTSGDVSFEVQGTSQEWVDNKLNELEELVKNVSTEHKHVDLKLETGDTKAAPRRKTQRGTGNSSNGLSGALATKWQNDLADKISAFVAERQKSFNSSAPKQAAILAVFLEDTLGIKAILSSDLELIYRKLGWKTINHVTQLNNAYGRNKFFTTSNGKYELTHAGRVFGRDTSKDKA